MIQLDLSTRAFDVAERTLRQLPVFAREREHLLLLHSSVYNVLEQRRAEGDTIEEDYLAKLVDMLVRDWHGGKLPSRWVNFWRWLDGGP